MKHEVPGPSPVMTLAILLACIIVLGAAFALIKVFLLEQGIPREEGRVEVFFCQVQNCSRAFINEVDRGAAISCAFYELNHPAIIDALAAKGASVAVDDENAAEVHGLAVDATPSSGLMHHKFCVIDGKEVISGSMNPTVNDVERNDNNLLVIESSLLARHYAQEFDVLVQRSSESDAKRTGKPVRVNISGAYIEQRFCPQDGCEAAVVQEIASAQHEVAFMLFTFTSDPVGNAMADAAARGAVVHGVVENRQSDQYSEHVRLQGLGLDVRNDGNKYTMHHKVIIIDNATVITGSFNPTASATTKNDENLLIIRDGELALRYMQEFQRVMAAAR
jgi:phosphatidylserine/phosphatidylglycerophosphate/cardiolipin synthase-like enzyme